MRLRGRVGVGLLLAAALVTPLAIGVFRRLPAPAAPAAELVLLRRVQTLRALAARETAGELLARGDVLLAMHEHLLQDLLTSVLPLEAEVADGYRVRIERATASFEDGLALVRFDGRAAAPGSGSYAELQLFAGVDRVLLEPQAGELRARLTVFAVDSPRAQLAGRSADVGRAVAALGPAGLEALAAWLPAIPIPITLQTQLELPAIATRTVRIAAARLPLSFAVRDVAVFRQRLWISLGAPVEGAAADEPPGLLALIRPGEVAAAAEEQPTLLGVARLGCSRARRRDGRLEPGELERVHAFEASRFARRLAGDRVVQEALSEPAEVAVVLRPEFVAALVQRAAAAYLRQVNVDLRGRVVRAQREERRHTPLGRKRVGEWRALVRLDGVRGTAEVDGARVHLERGNRLALTLPVRMPATPAWVEVAFWWRSSGLARVVCRDFELRRRLEGVLPPLRERLSGGLVLSAAADGLVARPYFEDRTLRLHPQLSDQSWAAVRQAIASQDKLHRCGIGIDTDATLGQLRELLARGFDARLPSELLRPVRLPAQFTEAVSVGGRQVRLAVEASGALVTRQGLWARARMHATPEGARAAAAAVSD